MNKQLLTGLLLLITLTLTAQPVLAATAPTAPQAPTAEKRFEGLWQKMTLRNLLRQQATVTPPVGEVKSVAVTPTPSPTPRTRRTTTIKTPTPTQKALTPTPTKRPVTPTPTKAQSTITPATIQPAPANDVTAFIMKEINDYRASQGLGSVQTSTETCNFAKTRAQEISTNFSHDGFTQRRDSKTLPYASWTAITENIAMTSNYKDVVTMWKNSAGHATNMRANTPYVCVMQHGNYFAYEGMKP
jgi:uncharacterized protein YkwD